MAGCLKYLCSWCVLRRTEQTVGECIARLIERIPEIYKVSFVLIIILILDILPSQCTLISVGHLEHDMWKFNAVFLSYTFTNFFILWILTIIYILNAMQIRYWCKICACTICGWVPYILCSVFAANLLNYIKQPSMVISDASSCIQYLIPFTFCFIFLITSREPILRYLHTNIMIIIMCIRLCIHLVLGFILHFNSALKWHAFLVSDSISACLTVIIFYIVLSRMVRRPSEILFGSTRRTDDYPTGKGVLASFCDSYAMISTGNICLNALSVSCIFTFFVGALEYDNEDELTATFFVHSCWTSFLLAFQVPVFALVVAMNAIAVHAFIKQEQIDIYGLYAILRQLVIVVAVYCVVVSLCMILGHKVFLNIFHDIELMEQYLLDATRAMRIFFPITIFSYSLALVLSGIFILIGRSCNAMIFRVISYWIFGIVLAIVFGFVADYRFNGIWIGYCTSFGLWFLFALGYWKYIDFPDAVNAVKNTYDLQEQYKRDMIREQIVSKKKSEHGYGATSPERLTIL
eukprot:482998_1